MGSSELIYTKRFHMRTITWGYGVHYLVLCVFLAFCGWMLQGMRVVCKAGEVSMFQQMAFVK